MEINISDIGAGQIRHKELPPELVERIKAFKEILGDVDPSSVEATLDNFKRDMHPEREVLIFEHIAEIFKMYLEHNPTDQPEIRKEIFGVLIGASLGKDDFENCTHLSREQINLLLYNYRGIEQ